ncbi:MAG: ATP-binding protein [Candidatus Bathyarchaeota archaeon]|nr:ATP-binding protein [Candidatus Bathyarchaeota archaeon]
MFGALQSLRLNAEQNENYRKFFLDADINRAKLTMLFFVIPVIGFAFNDYCFYGWSTEFFTLISVRSVLLLILAVFFIAVGRVKTYRSYDVLVFSAIFAIMVGGGIINLFRPQDFIFQAIITIVSLFIIYLVIPFRFLYQGILATIATVGEAAIILMVVQPSESVVLYTMLFNLFISHLIAAFSSWQLHSYRLRTYQEFVKRKEAQDKLEEHTKDLEKLVAERTEKLKNAERFAAIGETAGMVGHDLRNPLTGIANAAYYLKKKYFKKIDKTGKEMLTIIETNIEYSNKIINDLLDYSKNVNLDALTRTTPKAITSEALAMITLPPNIQVTNQTQATPEINVDFVKVKRVLINIIKNSIDAMPEGGSLTLQSEQKDNITKIILADTGPGISEENQKNLFKPLFTTKAKGMGFGLAICQRIIEAHKGKIVVESTPSKGTKVVIELPSDIQNGSRRFENKP